MFGIKKLQTEINRLESQVQDVGTANEDLRKQIREIEHMTGLNRLRHEFEIDEARSMGLRQGEELVREAEKRHATDIINRLEGINKLIVEHIPTVNVDKVIRRKDQDGE